VDIGLLDPVVQGLRHTANLGSNRFNGCPQRRVFMSSTIFATGSARWCSTFWIFPGAGSSLSRWPFQRAGLSPVRYLRTVAQLSTLSMRPRRRVAVSVLVFQMGSRTFKTWSSPTSWTSRPSSGAQPPTPTALSLCVPSFESQSHILDVGEPGKELSDIKLCRVFIRHDIYHKRSD
jgi:hypothetical protein